MGRLVKKAAMYQTIKTTERQYHSCLGCPHHQMEMKKSGKNPVYKHECTHSDIPEFRKKKRKSGNLGTRGHTPNWCPFLLEDVSPMALSSNQSNPYAPRQVKYKEALDRLKKELDPEDDENLSFGIVLQPTNSLTLTADWWSIEQEGVIGILPSGTHLLYDSLLRSQGSFNPAVIRDVVDNEVIQVNNAYMNLNPRSIEGMDFSATYEIDTRIGDWTFMISAAQLTKFDQEADSISAEVIAAQEAGNPATPDTIVIAGAGDLMQQNGRPEWRSRASIRWRLKQWGAGVAYRYVSEFEDTSTTATVDGEVMSLPIDSFATVDTYVDYRFGGDNFLSNSRLRLGVRNLNDEAPSIADESFGYYSSVQSNRGRYYYVNFKHEF